MAGVVESVGSNVTRFQAGDPVFGTGKGAFAQFACAPAKNLARKPEGISFAQAASVPIAALTALQGLRDSGQLKAGQTVLINGAAGGVGTFAVQIARHLGARVTGVCSTHNLELVRALGAEDAIDYTRQDFVQSATRYNVLFELVGNRSLSECRQVLHPRGIFVGCGGGGPEKGSGELLGMMAGRAALSPFVRQKLTGVLAKVNSADLETLGAWIESGAIKPVLDRTYPLAQTADAIRYVESGHVRGKVLIEVA
jgi:NADPH:quinone reductase-like Zn-dependent oxidoreductase